MRPHSSAATSQTVLPDALLVHRVAALSDKNALAYSFLFDGEAADVAVAAVLREVWRSAASFDAARGSVGRWLAALTRRVACDRLRGQARPALGPTLIVA